MQTIYSFLEDYLKNPSSFAARYRLSKKYGNDFHLEVDSVLLKNGFDLKKMKMVDVFRFLETNDKNCDLCPSFQYNSIDALIALSIYDKNKIAFASSFYRTKKETNYKNYFLKILRFFEPGFTLDNKNAGKILYDVVYPKKKEEKCVVCGVRNVPFIDTTKGYSKYCSNDCSLSVCKMSAESIRKATDKRMRTIKERAEDPIWLATRHSKLSGVHKKRYENPDERLKQSIRVKKAIERGVFTPNITNSWTKWTSKIGKKKFRSNFDALFFMYSEINDLDYQYEKLRIPYYFEGTYSIYIVDFISEKNKTAIEIKPSSLVDTPKNVEKQRALEKWCSENGYLYETITEKFLKDFFVDYYHKCDNQDYFEVLHKIRTSYRWGIA